MSLQNMKMLVRALRKGQNEALSDLRTSDTVRQRTESYPGALRQETDRNRRSEQHGEIDDNKVDLS